MIVVPVARGTINGVAFSPDGQLLAAACPDGWLKVWAPADLRSGEPLWQERYETFDSSHVQFSPDGKYLFACGDGGGAWVWEVAKGPPGERLPGPPQDSPNTMVLTCSRDGKYVAWAGGYRHLPSKIAVAQIKPRKFHKQFKGHDEAVGILAATPDGLISGSADCKLRFWDWATGRMYHQLSMRGFVRGLAVSPGGDRFVASCGKIIHLWPLTRSARGKGYPGKARELRGHTKMVSCLEFSPDGRTLASSGDDHTLRLWDVASETERRQFAPGIGPLHWIAFAPDGLTLAVTSDKGHLVLIDLDD